VGQAACPRLGDRVNFLDLAPDARDVSLKEQAWQRTAKVERANERGPSDRTEGRERQAERGAFNEPPPF
jgi:hypothetical protein